MNTVEDFENAPVGATATSRDGRHMYRREAETLAGADWVRGEGDGRLWADAEGLAHYGYTLGPALTAPTTAREALDLAWELAHPLKEGQYIPEGTACLARFDDGYLSYYETPGELITSESRFVIRTLDPLPDPEPDWLDAPAVLARLPRGWEPPGEHVFIRTNGGTHWKLNGLSMHWTQIRDVTPLYPKGQDA